MSSSFEAMLKTAATQQLLSEYRHYEVIDANSYNRQPLDAVGKNLLAQRIMMLPEEHIALLIFRYCLNIGPHGTEQALNLQYASGRLIYLLRLLSTLSGMADGTLPDDATMKGACRMALNQYMMQTTNVAEGKEPVHKPLGGAVRVMFRRLAVAAAVAALTASVAFAVSPELRAGFFRWVVNVFPQYSQIGAASVQREPTQMDFEQLKGYRPSSLPDGYTMLSADIEFPLISYSYTNGSDYWLSFDGFLVSRDLTLYNTENAAVETLTYLEQPAFYWKNPNGQSFFVWQQDGFQFHIIGKITKDEAIKMAKSTKFEK